MIEPLRRDIEQLIRLTARQLDLNEQMALRQCEVESSFDFRAASPSRGGVGLFQITKGAEKELNERILKQYATKFDFLRGVKVKRDDWRSNIFGGLMYLRHLIDLLGSDARGLAAYHRDHLQVFEKIKKLGPAWWTQLPRDTGEYLQKILGADAPNAHVDYKVA